MAATDLPDSDLFAKVPSRLRLLKRAEISTDTLDLDALFPVDIAGSGMFELKGHQESSLATLLDALPVCAFLIDHSQRIRMLNYRCRTICKERSQLKRTSFGSLFPLPVNASKARALIDRVLRERKAKIWEAQMELQGNRIWGRMHLRPLRMEGEIYVLLVLQDMTVERRQLYIIKKNERELRRWAAELEERVAKRTMELERVNAQLRMEIVERKSAQAALRRVNQELENRVAARTTELSRANEDLRREVEQRKQAQLELQQSSETVSALFNATTDVAYLVDTHGAILAVNKSFVFRYGGDPKALVGRRLQRVLPPELVARLTPKFLKVIRTGQSVRFELNFGGIISDDTFSPVVGSDGSVESVAVFSRDVTGRKHAEQKLSLAGKIIQSSNEGILVTDALGAIVDVNEAFCRLTGYSREEVIGQSTQMLQSDRHPAEFYQYMAAVLKNTGQWTGEVWGRRKNGEVYPKLLSMSAVRNRADKVTHYVGIITDITHIKRTEERLHRMAHFDPLTQLPNRVLFRSRLQQALVDSGRHKRTVALMLLDLDRFKHINDSLGHKAGDDLLDAVAKRLTGVVRKSDTVARLAGDEFTIILPEVSGAKAVASVARKIIDLFSAPFAIGGREVFVTASVGITLYPADGSQVDRLLRNADMALYGAKEQGKNTFQFFSEEMNREVLERLDLELAMRGALERNEFVVYYQPRLDCRTGRVSIHPRD
jgi:diguanylate cyclase (GGDEF)-like protein/PAS domain S-box-containing protein